MKHVHFIGICGVGMGALAIMMKNRVNAKGDAIWKVTGSDSGFYPPISLHLKKHKIEYYAGWHSDKIGKPNLVIVGNVAGSENPEWKFVQENKIPYVSYPELIGKELVKKNSIVCAGTYGKTSTSALLSWILINANLKPAYMFGGLSNTPELASDDLGGDWSVLEGDEYKTSRWDNSPKFSHYSPTHLLLTAIKWDHADIYPTEKKYFEAFEKLVASIPKNGLIVINKKITKNDSVGVRTVIYGESTKCDYSYSDILQTINGLEFEIKTKNKNYKIKTNLIGEYQAENICGAFAVASEIGIKPEIIIKAIENFNGLKRRLEKRGETKNGAIIFDDIAHSPAKAQSVLETLSKIYKGKIYCIFEPNTGNRELQSTPSYNKAFDKASEVIIPRLTKLKNNEEYLDGEKLTKIINDSSNNAIYIENDDELINYLQTKTTKDDCIVFCGSHGFRGMIEELICLRQQSQL